MEASVSALRGFHIPQIGETVAQILFSFHVRMMIMSKNKWRLWCFVMGVTLAVMLVMMDVPLERFVLVQLVNC